MASGLGELSGGVTLSRVLLAMLGLAAASRSLIAPAMARDSLGMFDRWGGFSDPAVPRCYAIARAERSRHDATAAAFADVASWPRHGIRGQVHFRLSRRAAPGSRTRLAIGGRQIALAGLGADAWVADRRMNPAVVAAMRAAPSMRVLAHDDAHRRFVDSWQLAGAASAIDAATIACAALH